MSGFSSPFYWYWRYYCNDVIIISSIVIIVVIIIITIIIIVVHQWFRVTLYSQDVEIQSWELVRFLDSTSANKLPHFLSRMMPILWSVPQLSFITAHRFISYTIMKQCVFINTQLSAKQVTNRIWIHVYFVKPWKIKHNDKGAHVHIIQPNIFHGFVLWLYSDYVSSCSPFGNESRQLTLG